MTQAFDNTDLLTFTALHNAITAARSSNKRIISLLGSARIQEVAFQQLTANYLELLAPWLDELVFIIGGRGEYGSIMHTSVDCCFQFSANTFIVGVNPIFDLENKVPQENVFGFNNISLRCYALTQLADLMIAFPGGIGTLQEIIVPMMHRKLDCNVSESLLGPTDIFIPTELKNPVTDFISILDNHCFISKSGIPSITPVKLSNFADKFIMAIKEN